MGRYLGSTRNGVAKTLGDLDLVSNEAVQSRGEEHRQSEMFRAETRHSAVPVSPNVFSASLIRV